MSVVNDELKRILLHNKGDKYDVVIDMEGFLSKFLREYNKFLREFNAIEDVDDTLISDFCEEQNITYVKEEQC